jgi:hypothetical protein
MRQFHADNLDFPGSGVEPDIAALGSGIHVGAGHSNPHCTMQVSSPAPPADNGKTIKKEQKTKRKLGKGKHGVMFPNNVYVSSTAGGKGRAKVGGAGVPAETCILM